ncbi:MATE family efflux transporter [Paracidovorax valerianellae]|uniref:Putative efflux protein, MATE family n=1 Tax=Paracidovorax valerianellae TaxID=187868 RepID=A0A1G6HWL0_9BURK|nr:MATE family efflux transporter [Paracidovorax valerianellae]MDA8446941.1 MATE family efflux transporter [Paracidovorax valerianellae]SDB98652.1 putative efflux protein, MATE family [Paracidovorax valerianellae]
MTSASSNPADLDPRTRRMLEAPLAPLMLRMAAPNVLIMVAQASAGLIETWFIGRLGTDALAGMALVFPIVMLMQMTSAGAMGGAIASAIARALGRRDRAAAESLAWAGLVIAVAFGLFFTVVLWWGGAALYRSMGGEGASLAAALTYSHVVFAGAVLIWLFNALSAVVRGTGNMALPAKVTTAGTLLLVPVSPLLIFGWGPIPGLGIAGGALALVLYYLGGTLAMCGYLRSRHSLLRLTRSGLQLRATLFGSILRVGLAGAVSTVATNLTIGIATALTGHFGPAAIAGYGTASRLEYLLVPLVFGLGAPLVTIVGTCMGAGRPDRALKATWIGAAVAFAMTECIGIVAALFPHAWLGLFGQDAAMHAAGSQYLQVVGPVYGFFGLGLVLYFASQGAGRLAWPVGGNIARLLVAGIGGWWALRSGGTLTQVFMAQAVALVVYGLLNAAAIAGGAWFGRVGWPRSVGRQVRLLDGAGAMHR